ncbi:MAG TPA: AI-2E family transporter, partial [Patescibacteria group bacterium]
HRLTNMGLSLLDNSLTYIPSVAGFLFETFMVLIVSFYFVLDKDRINNEIYTLLPKKWHGHAKYLQELIDTSFGSFLRMQIMFGIVAGIATWLIMTAFGVDFAASTSLIAGLLTIVPVIGGILALIPPVAIAFLIDPARGLLVLITLIVMQQIVFNIIGPKLLGKALQLHPIIVLLSFIIGYKIAGGFGVIFAVPVFGILFVILHQVAHHFLDEK